MLARLSKVNKLNSYQTVWKATLWHRIKHSLRKTAQNGPRVVLQALKMWKTVSCFFPIAQYNHEAQNGRKRNKQEMTKANRIISKL